MKLERRHINHNNKKYRSLEIHTTDITKAGYHWNPGAVTEAPVSSLGLQFPRGQLQAGFQTKPKPIRDLKEAKSTVLFKVLGGNASRRCLSQCM